MTSFLIKCLLNGIVLIPLLYVYTDATWMQMIATALALVIIAFFVGDLWILDETNNTVATLADIGLAGLLLWAVGAVYDWGLSFGELCIIVLGIAVVEAGFHYYIARNGLLAK